MMRQAAALLISIQVTACGYAEKTGIKRFLGGISSTGNKSDDDGGGREPEIVPPGSLDLPCGRGATPRLAGMKFQSATSAAMSESVCQSEGAKVLPACADSMTFVPDGTAHATFATTAASPSATTNYGVYACGDLVILSIDEKPGVQVQHRFQFVSTPEGQHLIDLENHFVFDRVD